MNSFKASRRLILIIIAVALIVLGGGVAYYLGNNQTQALTKEELSNKFNCNRITADARETDVFCSNPKFYNNPQSVTKADFYKYYACDERLKNGVPPEAAKTNDPGYYQAYYACKDTKKLDNLRLDFIKSLENLKAESD